MIARDELTAFLDELLLAPSSCTDSSNNGLQVEGSAAVERVVFGVDACAELFDAAADQQAHFIIVHHGLSWRDSLKYLTQVNAGRVGRLFRGGMSLYAAHLPLDMHPEVGHNARIADGLELSARRPHFEYGGAAIGYVGDLAEAVPLPSLVRRVDRLLDTRSAVWPFGADANRRLGIVSGGGADGIQECVAAKVDCLITGEVSHQHWHVAKECGVNVIAAGHYKSEIPGLLAVKERIERQFDVTCQFVDLPTGL